MKHPKLCVILTENWTMTDPRDLKTFASFGAIAEQAGLDGVMLGEHVVAGPNAAYLGVPDNPRDWIKAGNQDPPYPHPSNMLLLASMAATTSKIRLMAGGLLTPLRHPLTVAKEMATLDLISEGRFIAMPTVSWQREEYEALGSPFEQRGEVLDEQLEIWQLLWTEGSPVSYQGQHFDFSEIYVEPAPFRPSGPDLWIGARAFAPWALRRAVKYGKGFFPILPPSDDELCQLSEALSNAGRSMTELELGAFIFGPPFTDSTSLLDLDKALAVVPDLVERGFSTLVIKPSQYIDHHSQLDEFCRTYINKVDDLLGI